MSISVCQVKSLILQKGTSCSHIYCHTTRGRQYSCDILWLSSKVARISLINARTLLIQISYQVFRSTFNSHRLTNLCNRSTSRQQILSYILQISLSKSPRSLHRMWCKFYAILWVTVLFWLCGSSKQQPRIATQGLPLIGQVAVCFRLFCHWEQGLSAEAKLKSENLAELQQPICPPQT